MHILSTVKNALLHFAFPHVCEGCGTNIIATDHYLCVECLSGLPETAFEQISSNPVEKVFWGRIPVTSAAAQYYFTKGGLIQHLMHELKYKGNKEIGIYMGQLMGAALSNTNRFRFVDALVPLPLYPAKQKKRGYNQAALLCEGMAAVMEKPVLDNIVQRSMQTETQTLKNRVDRWKNMEGGFSLNKIEGIEGQHLLLVDDVITTGATLEACGQKLLSIKDARLSIATLCFSAGN